VYELTLKAGHSFTTMFVVGAVAILLAALFYYQAYGTLKRQQWQTLLVLRSLAIALIVLLLFRPVFSYYKDLEERPTLIFLVDTSSSMGISDDATGVTRYNQALAELEKWWEKLKDDFNLRLVEFAEQPRALKGLPDLPRTPEGKATSLSRALAAATKQVTHGRVEAAILLSDGRHNSARNPLEIAPRLGMVVHTIGVGTSLRSDVSFRDVQVTGMDCPDRLLKDNMVKIKGTIEGIGLSGRVIQVLLEEDGKKVGEQELTLDQAGRPQEVVFDFRPTKKGRHSYTVRVDPLAEEKIKENNQRSMVALVVEPGIRVLYLEGKLRAEYGALVDRFLAKDPDLEFCALVRTRQNEFLMRTNMQDIQLKAIPSDAETINKFDVFIIGDLDSQYIHPPQQELIIKRVREGAGLLMLGGYESLGPGGYADAPLGKVLPVVLGNRDIGQITDTFLPTLTVHGTNHPIFANIAGFFPTEQQAEPKTPGLPPLKGCTRVEGRQAAATVLATFAAEAESMPVLAVQPLEKGRTAVFCGDTTRNWQQGPRANDQETPYLRFWGQMVRWLAGRSAPVETGAGVVASTEKAYYEPDEPIKIEAVVRDQEGQGTANAKVMANLRGPEGRPEQVQLLGALGPGHYQGTYEPKAAGTFEIVVEAKVGAASVSSEKLTVEIGRPNLEFEKLDLNDKLLEQIAVQAHGRYVHLSAAERLIDQLDRTQHKKRVPMVFPEYRWPVLMPLWMFFVCTLTIEWVLRKKFQLR
jgi:uncharacterized membrane protein